ncbi:DNA-binding protein [Niallia sp. MER TA 168]|uniref:DNA-binding protein n=1 Tax=Niallia sp. MER TA 168 TaxID=2939568 RepID=UPI00203CE6A8|nr:DNA-binding protein [Niallia sp. MER TA 168]MCM3363184.1 DNA-binding protein [Niallia sp. MER TA 168]
MIEVKLDEKEIKNMYQDAIQKRLEEMDLESILMDTKQLCKTLSLSWPTVEKLFLSDPNFPSLRVGKKWLFNRKQVQEYVDRWYMDARKKA